MVFIPASTLTLMIYSAAASLLLMENYDPEFVKLAKEGDILVGGFNFEQEVQREQAAPHSSIRN
jgi:3-isopropylmalate dehydratase small subunit